MKLICQLQQRRIKRRKRNRYVTPTKQIEIETSPGCFRLIRVAVTATLFTLAGNPNFRDVTECLHIPDTDRELPSGTVLRASFKPSRTMAALRVAA